MEGSLIYSLPAIHLRRVIFNCCTISDLKENIYFFDPKGNSFVYGTEVLKCRGTSIWCQTEWDSWKKTVYIKKQDKEAAIADRHSGQR